MSLDEVRRNPKLPLEVKHTNSTPCSGKLLQSVSVIAGCFAKGAWIYMTVVAMHVVGCKWLTCQGSSPISIAKDAERSSPTKQW